MGTNTPFISIVLFAVAAFLGAVGQFLYKSGAAAAKGGWLSYLVNAQLAGGVICYVAVMVLYPMYASTFIWAALIAWRVDGTSITAMNVFGMGPNYRGHVVLGLEGMSDSAYEPLERRPIQSRDTRWARAITQFLVRIGASPNAISLLGMLAAVAAGAAFFATSYSAGLGQRALWLVGAALCQVRLLCNLFDGMVAVARKTASRTGELYNEVPDRVSDAAIFIGLGYAAGGQPALGYLAALMAVFVAYIRAMAKSLGAPNDFCGPMAKPQRMALATILGVYLSLTPETWRLPWGEARVVLAIVIAGGIVTAIRRLARAAIHLRSNAT